MRFGLLQASLLPSMFVVSFRERVQALHIAVHVPCGFNTQGSAAVVAAAQP